MDLVSARTKFVELSGRYDLANADWTDNGADYYLKAGMKFLDRRAEFDKDVGKLFAQMAVGEYFKAYDSYRTQELVWFATAAGRYQLEYLSPGEMQVKYGTKPYADVTNGTPKYFTFAILRTLPDGTALDIIGNYGSEHLVDGTHLSQAGILIMAPTDTAGMLEIWGKFETPFPSAEDGTNYWLDHFDYLAVNAALYQLEVSYRNTQGQKDWLAAIDLELEGLGKDVVEDDANRAPEMEG